MAQSCAIFIDYYASRDTIPQLPIIPEEIGN